MKVTRLWGSPSCRHSPSSCDYLVLFPSLSLGRRGIAPHNKCCILMIHCLLFPRRDVGGDTKVMISGIDIRKKNKDKNKNQYGRQLR